MHYVMYYDDRTRYPAFEVETFRQAIKLADALRADKGIKKIEVSVLSMGDGVLYRLTRTENGWNHQNFSKEYL